MPRVIWLIVVLIFIPAHPLAGKTVGVRGYYRKDGTYVRPHSRHVSGGAGDYVPPAFVPPPVEPRTKYRMDARTSGRTNPPLERDALSHQPDEPEIEPPRPQANKREIEPPRRLVPVIEEHEYRLWTDITGRSQVLARFRSYASGLVKIVRKDNGKIVEIHVERLSLADQQYITELRKEILSGKFRRWSRPK